MDRLIIIDCTQKNESTKYNITRSINFFWSFFSKSFSKKKKHNAINNNRPENFRVFFSKYNYLTFYRLLFADNKIFFLSTSEKQEKTPFYWITRQKRENKLLYLLKLSASDNSLSAVWNQNMTRRVIEEEAVSPVYCWLCRRPLCRCIDIYKVLL